MYSYDGLRERAGRRVSQTIDAPVKVVDYFELTDVFAALAVVLLFGIVIYSWSTMLALLILILGVGPQIKKRYPRGILRHYPYRHFSMSLPGLINPGCTRRYSD